MAMHKEELWKIFTNKNPHWETEGVKFTPSGLKKFFETTFDKGHKLGVANGKAIESKKSNGSKTNTNKFVDDLISGTFK